MPPKVPTGRALLPPVTVMALMLNGALPLLDIVTVLAGLVVRITCEPKARASGSSSILATGAAMPVPVSNTVIAPLLLGGRLLALLTILKVPVLSPTVPGENVSVTVQPSPGGTATVALHVPPNVPTGRALLPPVTVMAPMLSGALPLLVTVTVLAALVVRTTCGPKAKAGASSSILATGAAMPVPIKSISDTALVAGTGADAAKAGTPLWVMVSLPTVPFTTALTTLGVNTTLISHVVLAGIAPALIGLPRALKAQLPGAPAKRLNCGLEKLKVEILSGTCPEFLIVMVRAGCVVVLMI